MISREQAEQVAVAMNAARPDWPVSSLMTIIGDLKSRPFRLVFVAAVIVATDPDSKTPGRLREDGPWWSWQERTDPHSAARERAAAERAERLAEQSALRLAAQNCELCDPAGYELGTNRRCRHGELVVDNEAYWSSEVRRQIRPTKIGENAVMSR